VKRWFAPKDYPRHIRTQSARSPGAIVEAAEQLSSSLTANTWVWVWVRLSSAILGPWG